MKPVQSFRKPGGRAIPGIVPGLVFLLVLCGCAVFNPPTFTQEQLRGVETSVSYREVLSEYRSLAGTKVLLGGVTSFLDNRTRRAFVQVAPAPLNSVFRPGKPDTGSRVLLVFPYPVDPSMIADGHRITVIGRIRRMRRPVTANNGGTVRLVTLDVLALHTWVPRIRFIGGSPFPIMTPGFSAPYQTP